MSKETYADFGIVISLASFLEFNRSILHQLANPLSCFVPVMEVNGVEWNLVKQICDRIGKINTIFYKGEKGVIRRRVGPPGLNAYHNKVGTSQKGR